ncbi:MAG: PilN domain-containing protein [Methylococcaceae bacterium]|nr:PilN domain-containing protein [Methylococcaceae bacterium]
MLKFDTPFGTQLSQFYQWWIGELLSMVPSGVQKLFGGAAEYLVLTRDEHGVSLSHLRPTGEAELVHLLLDETGGESRTQYLQENAALSEAKTALRLTGAQGLRKQFKLPMAAEENLRQVVSFEMDRMTPFKSDQVYFSTVIVSRLKATRQILVDLILTPRAKLDALLDELAAAGWRPDIVYLAGDAKPGGYNLLPDKFKPPQSRWPGLINGTLGIILFSLITLLIALPIWSARTEANRLQGEVKKTAKIAQEVEAMREESEKLLHQARFLQDKKHTEPVLVDTLEELSRVIPDGTWLNGMQFMNRRIIIQGQSPSASSLIQGIEASDFFNNVSFVSPVTKDTSNGLERFQIASDVVNGRYSEKPH